jgi:putative addiction module component (TIGR02574 family)
MALTFDQNLNLDQLEEELLSLPESNRIRLATTLLHSLPIPDGILEEGTPEFEAEIARRCAEIEDGTAVMIPHEEVMRHLDELLARG